MHRISTLALCFGMLFTLSLIVNPVGQVFASTQEGQMAAKAVTIDGKVKAVTDASLTVVDAQNAEHSIAVDEKTKILKDGKTAAAADIKADDAVTVVASKGAGDTLIAKLITVKSPASN